MLGAFVEHVGFRSIRALWARIILKFGKSDAGKLRGKLNRSPNLFSRVNWTFLRKSLKLGNFRSGGWSSNEVALKLSASSSALRRSRTFPCNIFLEFFPVPYHDVLVQRRYGYILAPNVGPLKIVTEFQSRVGLSNRSSKRAQRTHVMGVA